MKYSVNLWQFQIYLTKMIRPSIMKNEKTTETSLVLATGLLLLFYIFELKVFILLAFIIGIIGIFIKPLANLISRLWLKLGELMGWVVSKIVLSIIYFLFLLPLSLIYRLVKKDPLKLKKKDSSCWTTRNHKYTSKDLENVW